MTQLPPNNPTQTPISVVNLTHVPGQPGVAEYRFSDQRIIQQLESAVAGSKTIDQLLTNLGSIVVEQSDCVGLWASQKNQAGDFGSAHCLIPDENESLWTVVEDHATEMITRVARTRQICSSPLRSKSETELVVSPICIELDAESPTPVQLVLIGCFRAEHQSVLRLQWLIGMVSQAIARWHQHRNLKHLETKTRSLNDTIGLVHSLDKTSSISEASMVIANYLRRVCNADQVSICLSENPTHPDSAKLAAISDVEQIDLSCESNRLIGNACRQALHLKETIVFPAAADAVSSPALLALEKYCKANAIESCIGLPLVSEKGRIIGSVLVAGPQEKLINENFLQYLVQIIKMVSGHFDVVMRANRGSRDIFRASLSKVRSANFTKIAIISLICASLLMLVPMPYRVACDCEIQPVMRRYVASPHAGILEKTFVESGDLVQANQIVASLDGRQLRIEMSALRAEYDGARKRRDSALADGDVALSQIARSEMERHEARIAILEQQTTNLEVRSTIDGIVVSGDLEKVEGAPLEMGQTLFEIAPLDEMLAEIGIPESEIQYVKPGMEVAIKLNAFPFKTWTGTIELIQPRTEIIDDKSVFIAQVKLPNSENQLRPGMQGSAKIKSKTATLGWNLFHQPWESCRYWLIW